MAAPRLPFLWPALYKTIEHTQPALRSARAASQIRHFNAAARQRRPDTVQQRYGTANQPPPHLGGEKSLGPPTKKAINEAAPKALPKIGEKLQHDGEIAIADGAIAKAKDGGALDSKTISAAKAGNLNDAGESSAVAKPSEPLHTPEDKPLETLLNSVPDPSNPTENKPTQPTATNSASTTTSATSSSTETRPAPEEENPNVRTDEHAPPIRAPHINTPRYMHHFDTYGLVRRLVDSGWTEDHAITLMKSMRLMLADNMDLATSALVSKSQVENETYLFRAACAELKTEVTARRQSAAEKMRTERGQLQHELDILTQRLGQESLVLKDELKGMFDDRKMAVRNEQRNMESKVQRLNYKITVDLQADAKSDVEGLRWVMTRRVIIALGAVIVMVLGSLKLYSNAVHERELEAKRRANMRSGGTQTGGYGPDERLDMVSRDGSNLATGDILVKDGENPAFVSLG